MDGPVGHRCDALAHRRPPPRRACGAKSNSSVVTSAAHKAAPPQSFHEQLARRLFASRCEDLGVQPSSHGFRRFEMLTASALSDQQLELRAIGLGPMSAEAIVHVLSQPGAPQLSVLELEGNTLGDQGAMAIAKLLSCPSGASLVWLGLGSNGIGLMGGIGLASALRENRSLTAIDLSSRSLFRCRNTMGRKASGALLAAATARPAELQVGKATQGSLTAPSWRQAPSLGGADTPAPPGGSPSQVGSAWVEAPPSASLPARRLAGSSMEPAASGGCGSDQMSDQASIDPVLDPMPAALITLCEAIEVNPLLAVLRLGGNSLGPAGAALLAGCLGRSRGLAELSLPNNDFGADGIEELAPAV